MKAKVTWINGRAFLGESGSGHGIVMDGAPESGGRNIGVRPMEMMLLGLGGCTAFDVVMILEKARAQVTGLEIELEGDRNPLNPGDPAKVFTHVKLIYTVKGKGLKPELVERAINLSAEKYCSASKMFEFTAKLEHEWKIIEV